MGESLCLDKKWLVIPFSKTLDVYLAYIIHNWKELRKNFFV